MGDCTFLNERLQAGRIILLDGATGTELEKRGVPMNSKAWTAEAVLSCPEAVQAVHRDYILAGAEIITVNSFSLAKHMLLPAGLSGKFRKLNEAAVRLAILARTEVAISSEFNDVISPEQYALEAGNWIQMGAQIIGGCCGIGPVHIGELKKRFCS